VKNKELYDRKFNFSVFYFLWADLVGFSVDFSGEVLWGKLFGKSFPQTPFKNFSSVVAVEYGLYGGEGDFLKYTGL